MEHQPQVEAEEQEQPDTFLSEYRASLQSLDYGDVRVFPDTSALIRLSDYWADEMQNPERSGRSKKEIEKILVRISFELHSRNFPMKSQIESLEETLALEFDNPELAASQEQRAA
ncbi:MAG: hypothetical protein JWM07_198 [Candidatus Saccharibacteria bacterium]|nr:hypothetical protein [Candidatus Saccharibacteria bacterium]